MVVDGRLTVVILATIYHFACRKCLAYSTAARSNRILQALQRGDNGARRWREKKKKKKRKRRMLMKVDLVNINKIKNSLLSFSCLITAVPHSNYVNHLVLRTGVAHSPYRYTVAPQFFCVPGASVTFAKHLHWHLNPLPPRTHPNPTPGVVSASPNLLVTKSGGGETQHFARMVCGGA